MNKYHIITIGCQMNKSDSERIAGHLEKQGFVESSREKADLAVLNTCGVRQSAEDRVYGLIGRIKKENPGVKIVLAGCLSERDDVKKRLKDKVDAWLPIKELPKLSRDLRVTPRPSKLGAGRASYKLQVNDYLNFKPKYSSKISAFVPIGNGCNNFCAYCVVPYARGREVYRPVKEIFDEVGELIKKGYKEIYLIAQNVNSYKFQIPNSEQLITFSDLLRMINDIPGNFWVRFATSHPKDMSDKLIAAVAECKKVCEHIHLPAQAGDDEVLQNMNRGYTITSYKKLIEKIRTAIPGASIMTDIIVGFPGETKEQFNNTAKLFKELKFDMAYIARYSPRPGTMAAKLEDDVLKEEKKKREEELMKILRKTALANNKKYIGQIVEVLIDKKDKQGQLQGRTRTNKNVKVYRSKNLELNFRRQGSGKQGSKNNLAGEFILVRITEARDFGLAGEIKNPKQK